jgi:large subunit ribosomal protein L21e
MAQKSSGSQQGARDKLSKTVGESTTVNDHLKEFEEGETARIQINPSITEGRVHVRYHGTNVEVTGERGDAYEVKLKDGNKTKTLYIKPVHLEKVEE